MPIDPSSTNVKAFVARLEQVPWFSALGAPVPEADVPRLHSWDEWPGPESEDGAIIALSLWHQDWHDALLEAHPHRKAELEELWERVEEKVMAAAAPQVPHDPSADAWHPPTMAVWQAVWTAGLVAWHLACTVPIPADLAAQWNWYMRGHWPCGYAYLRPDEKPGPLLVY